MKLRDDFENGPSLQLISQRSRPEAYRDDPHMQIPGVVDIKIVKAGFCIDLMQSVKVGKMGYYSYRISSLYL